jgi:hypothetical protein
MVDPVLCHKKNADFHFAMADADTAGLMLESSMVLAPVQIDRTNCMMVGSHYAPNDGGREFRSCCQSGRYKDVPNDALAGGNPAAGIKTL